MAINPVFKERESVLPAGPTIYGKLLNWHAVREERADKTIAPYQRAASVFRATIGGVSHEIVAEATDTEVQLYPKDNLYICFRAKIFPTQMGHTMVEFDTHLKYPEEAGTLLSGTRYEGMPRLSEVTPSVIAYFENCIGRNIDGIRSAWEKDPRSENYQRYMEAKGSGPHSPHLARTANAAGINAQNLGFIGEVDIQEKVRGSRRDIHYLQVDYFRPGVSMRKTA